MKNREPNPATMLAAVLATETHAAGVLPYRAARDAESLIRLGKRAERIAIQRCNGIERYDAKAGRVLAIWTEADEARADKACAKIAKEAANILEPYGATDIKASGDPRGFCLTFKLASGRSNSFDRNRWGV